MVRRLLAVRLLRRDAVLGVLRRDAVLGILRRDAVLGMLRRDAVLGVLWLVARGPGRRLGVAHGRRPHSIRRSGLAGPDPAAGGYLTGVLASRTLQQVANDQP